jgi:uncharacterized protein (TIGR00369 family)
MTAARMTVAELDAFLRTELPQMFNYDDLTIEHADGQSCLLTQRFRQSMLRPGGTVSGPTLMALADFAMYVVLLSAIGPVGLAVTTNLNINFLRKGAPGQDVLAAASLLKLGKRLAVGEVNLLSGTSPDPIAHVTSTYSIPNTLCFLRYYSTIFVTHCFSNGNYPRAALTGAPDVSRKPRSSALLARLSPFTDFLT